jgi:hypothetical protein
MTDRTLKQLLLVGSAATGCTALVSMAWGIAVALSIVAGGMWNVANLWCLSRALGVWLKPQQAPRRQRIGWFLVKFPLLYAAVFGLVKIPGISLIGFGIGFIVVIMSAVFVTLKALRSSQHSLPAHGG